MSIFIYTVGTVLLLLTVLAVVILPVFAMTSVSPWFCEKLGWHRNRDVKIFETSPRKGICRRCGRDVNKDEHGNWV